MAYGTINADKLVGSSGGTIGPDSSVFRNRIINGAMTIDQRNAGASVTASTGTYTLDRWRAFSSQASKFTVQQNAGSVTPPVGFSNYLGITSSSAYSSGASDLFVLQQFIEGFNTADLGWGTANAKTVTLSFQVYSSLTGTFSGSFINSAATRSYPFSYSIPVANTWTSISVTVAGDTSGTWIGATNGIGIRLNWNLGSGSSNLGTAGAWTGSELYGSTGSVSVVGTNGATFYITGVQLEKGSTATSFDYRPYGTELVLCQRYYETSFPIGTAPAQNIGITGHALWAGSSDGGSLLGFTSYFVPKRATATMTYYNPSAANSNFANGSSVNLVAQDSGGVSVYSGSITGTRTPVNWAASAEL